MMKKLLLTALAAFVVASLVAWGLRQRQLQYLADRAASGQLPKAVIVYCFHGNQRGPVDEKIESQAYELLNKSFAAPLKDGRLVWRVLNFEEPENAHFKEDCKIIASCIVLVDARSGRAGTAKNLQQEVWELVDDKEAFATFMRGEIEKALK
jgi:hypothetical protein